MHFFQIIGLTFMAGCIGAGLVWYGWGLAENVGTVVRIRRAARAAAHAESETQEEGDAAVEPKKEARQE